MNREGERLVGIGTTSTAQVSAAVSARSFSITHRAASRPAALFGASLVDPEKKRIDVERWLNKQAFAESCEAHEHHGHAHHSHGHHSHDVFHPPAALPGWPDADRRSRIVFITRGITRQEVLALWQAGRAAA
jgi:G3E family GTPase